MHISLNFVLFWNHVYARWVCLIKDCFVCITRPCIVIHVYIITIEYFKGRWDV